VFLTETALFGPPGARTKCDQAALVSVCVVALLRKGPYGDAAKKLAEFVQAGMIERITAGGAFSNSPKAAGSGCSSESAVCWQ
jgi:hypothetical protein